MTAAPFQPRAVRRPRAPRRALARVLAGALLVGAAGAPLTGCAGRSNVGDELAQDAQDRAQRRAEASRLHAEGDRAMRAGKAERAEELYRRAVTLDPENAGAWNNLGVCLMERNEGSQAAGAFVNAANLQPAHAGPYENLGVLYMRTGWAAQARDYFVRALERDPSSAVALRGYAQAVSAVMEPDDADLELLRRGLIAESDPRWRELIQRQVARVEEFQRERRRGTR